MALRFLILLAFVLGSVAVSPAEDGLEKGRAAYDRLCAFCHGAEGAGDGPAAAYLNPPPRDFTMGLYKWKTSPFDEYAPTEGDLERMIAGMRSHDAIEGWDGMNNTSMPGWADVMGKKEMAQVAAYILGLAGYEGAGKPSIDLSGKVKADGKSIERGRELFKDRCAECHGELGRGNATKKLRDDWGARTWPRDLTEGWTFRAGSTPEDIYARITVGIPGTQMPSFADPASNKVMTEAERWAVANYTASLSEPERKPSSGALIRAMRTERLPEGPEDELWGRTKPAGFHLFPQLFAADRHYTPSVHSVVVRAAYSDDEVAFLLEWDDPTNSMPWDEKAREIADGDLFPDSAAVQFPSGQMKPGDRPYFGMGGGMGGGKPVVIWQWKGADTAEAGQVARVVDARGSKDLRERADLGGVSAEGVYDRGRWRVMLKGPRNGAASDPAFEEGSFVPVAFALWDGSNGERGPRHTMTGWQWMELEKEGEGKGLFWPVVVGVIVFCVEMLWLLGARRKG